MILKSSFQGSVFFMAGCLHGVSLVRDVSPGESFPQDFPGVFRSGFEGRGAVRLNSAQIDGDRRAGVCHDDGEQQNPEIARGEFTKDSSDMKAGIQRSAQNAPAMKRDALPGIVDGFHRSGCHWMNDGRFHGS
jgi:hypothetical protein